MTQAAAHTKVCELGGDILASQRYLASRMFMQHGTTSVYDHSIRVAECCVRLDKLIPGNSDTPALVRGALLHDYFLYDWHDRERSRPHHATQHPLYALENAERDFSLSPIERGMIQSHMFPLPPTRVPMCREAWILTLADKVVSIKETLSGIPKLLRA